MLERMSPFTASPRDVEREYRASWMAARNAGNAAAASDYEDLEDPLLTFYRSRRQPAAARAAARTAAPAWHAFLDAELRTGSTSAVIVRTTARHSTTDPLPQIGIYAHGHGQSMTSRVYTGIRAIRNQVHMQKHGLVNAELLLGIQQCELLILLLEHEPWTADAQTISVHLHAWLCTFGLTHTKIVIFSPHPALLVCVPARRFSFVWDDKAQQHMLAEAPACLQTRHCGPRLSVAACDMCKNANRGDQAGACPVHSVPWQAVLNNVLVGDGPRAICIRGGLGASNALAYVQHMLDDNAGRVVLYRTVEAAKKDCFPTAERRRALREVQLVILKMPFYRNETAAARTSRQLSTILRQLDCEFGPGTQFLCLVQRQPTTPPHWAVLSMDASAHTREVYPYQQDILYVVPSCDMTPECEPVHGSTLSDYDTEEVDDEDSEYDLLQFDLSDADSVLKTSDSDTDTEDSVFVVVQA